MMSAKLGLVAADESLINELLRILAGGEIDMTLFFRGLSDCHIDDLEANKVLNNTSYKGVSGEAIESLKAWLERYSEELKNKGTDEQTRVNLMEQTNPLYVFRNFIAQLAIDEAEKGDFKMINELLEVFKNPYKEQPGKEQFAQKRPEWARTKVGCSMLSCSS